MRWVLAILLVGGTAAAQPGTYTQPPAQLQLTQDEAELLETGYISQGQHIGGGVAALFIGWGVGQAVQGRWHETGYIFTLGEPAAFGVILYGASLYLHDCPLFVETEPTSCQHPHGVGLFWGGLVALSALRIYEVYDAFAEPPEHNRRLRALRTRLGLPEPVFFGTANGGGGLGVTLSF